MLTASALLVVGASVLWAYRRILGGTFQKEIWAKQPWPHKRQASILALIALVLLAAGLAPGLLSPAPSAGQFADRQDSSTESRSGRGS